MYIVNFFKYELFFVNNNDTVEEREVQNFLKSEIYMNSPEAQ